MAWRSSSLEKELWYDRYVASFLENIYYGNGLLQDVATGKQRKRHDCLWLPVHPETFGVVKFDADIVPSQSRKKTRSIQNRCGDWALL